MTSRAAFVACLALACTATAGTLVVPDDAPSIQAAVTLASSGDTIVLSSGVYTGPGNRNVELQGKLLTIRSAEGASTCTIDCQYLGRAFRALANEPEGTTLEGLTITHGHVSGTNQQAGAIEVAEGAHLAVVDCTLVQNILGMKGRGGAIASFGSLLLDGCTFENNTVSEEFSLGAAVLTAGDATILDCVFLGNATNEGHGGAVSSYGTLVVSATTFENNHAKYGGAIEANGPIELIDCAFVGNTATAFNGLPMGGALRMVGSGGSIASCLFHGNTAIMGGAVVNGSGSLVLDRCRLVDNHAGTGGGGAALLFGSGSVEFRGCLLDGNDAIGAGGAIGVTSGSCAVLDCTLAWNVQTGGGAGSGSGGVFVDAGGSAVLANSVLWGNAAPSGTVQEQQLAAIGAVSLNACCLDGYDGSLGGAGNLADDPAFVDGDGADGIAGTLDDDLRLDIGSPCTDAGDNLLVPPGLATDLDGAARILDGDGDAIAVVDIGCYERPTATAGDLDGDGIVGGADLGLLLGGWGTTGPGDLDGNGVVDGADLGTLLALWSSEHAP